MITKKKKKPILAIRLFCDPQNQNRRKTFAVRKSAGILRLRRHQQETGKKWETGKNGETGKKE